MLFGQPWRSGGRIGCRRIVGWMNKKRSILTLSGFTTCHMTAWCTPKFRLPYGLRRESTSHKQMASEKMSALNVYTPPRMTCRRFLYPFSACVDNACYLWRHPQHSASTVGLYAAVVDCRAEVGDFDSTIFVAEEKILRLNVSVNNARARPASTAVSELRRKGLI